MFAHAIAVAHGDEYAHAHARENDYADASIHAGLCEHVETGANRLLQTDENDRLLPLDFQHVIKGLKVLEPK